MKCRLILAKAAANMLRRMDRDLQRRMLAQFDRLCDSPLSPPLSDWVEGRHDLRKSRVGSWRILFRVENDSREVRVVAIRPRGQAYRDLPS